MFTSDPADSDSTHTRRKRSDGIRTIEKVLEAAEREMDEHGYLKFNLYRVIDRSGVAKSSVYHHFGGRDGLIAALETSRGMRSLERGLADFERLLDDLRSGEEAFALIEIGLRNFASLENRQRRQRRISSLAAAHSASAIREVLANDQRVGTEVFAKVLTKARERGLCNPVEPIIGLAYLIQSMLVGRILVDLVDDPALDTAWEDAALETLRLTLRPTSPS